MSSNSLTNLTALVRAFCEARDWDRFHSAKELAIGLSTEASELLALFRFLDDQQESSMLSEPARRVSVENEVGDCLFFLLRFCQRTGIDPADALRAKLALNEKRYPVDPSRGKNAKYDQL